LLGAARRGGDGADAGGDGVFSAREEHGHEAAHDQVVQLLFGFRQARGRLQRGDDGKVIAHLAVVKDALGRPHVVVVQRRERVRREMPHAAVGQHLEGLLGHGQVVLGQRARVSTRVGQGLVALVQTLRQGQRGLCTEAELAVGLALQAGQVKQQGRCLRGGLALFGDGGLLAAHGVGNRLGFRCRPHAVGAGFHVFRLLPLGVEPLGGVFARLGAEGGVDFPVVTADELADLFLALHHQRQRGRLHTAHGGQKEPAIARVERRHGARAVDAHQPVGLRAAARGVGQPRHLLLGAQRVKAVADGLGRHALQPQALDGFAQTFAIWFAATGVLLDQTEDQLALAARVAGVDEFGHVLALGLFDHRVQARLGLVHGLEVKVRRDDGQVGKAPLAALHIKFFGRLDLHQVAHGAGDYIAVVLEVVVVLFKLAGHGGQCAHDVLRDGGFFCNYQGLGHFGALASHSGCPGCGRFYNSGLTRMHTHVRARTHMCAPSS
jgi:hypothetical protein